MTVIDLAKWKPETIVSLFKKHKKMPSAFEIRNGEPWCCGLAVLALEHGKVLTSKEPDGGAEPLLCYADRTFFTQGFDCGVNGGNPLDAFEKNTVYMLGYNTGSLAKTSILDKK